MSKSPLNASNNNMRHYLHTVSKKKMKMSETDFAKAKSEIL